LITSVVATFLDDRFAIMSISSFGIRPVRVEKIEGKSDMLWIVILLNSLIWLYKLVIVFGVVSSVLVFKVCCNEMSIRLYSNWLDGQVVQWRWKLIWWHWWQMGEYEWYCLCKICGVGRSSSRILILKDLRVEDWKLCEKFEIFWLLLIYNHVACQLTWLRILFHFWKRCCVIHNA